MTNPIGWVEVDDRAENVIKIVGEVDVSNVAEIEKALEEAAEGRRARHFIDLSETTYFDSSGIRLLFSLASRLRARRQELHVIVPQTGVTRRVLELTDLPGLVPMHASLDEVDR